MELSKSQIVFILLWTAESWALRSTHSGPSSKHLCGFQAYFREGHGDPSLKNNSSLGVSGTGYGVADNLFLFSLGKATHPKA